MDQQMDQPIDPPKDPEMPDSANFFSEELVENTTCIIHLSIDKYDRTHLKRTNFPKHFG